MPTSSPRSIRGLSDRRLRRLLAMTLMTTAVGLLAALPTAPAGASTPTITALPSLEVQELLSETPLTTLDVQQLTEQLSLLPGFGELSPVVLQEALAKTIQTVSGEGGTLGNLLEPASVVPTLKANLKEALGMLAPLLEGLLGGDPTAKLTDALEGSNVSELVEQLLGSSAEPQALIASILAATAPNKLETLLGSRLSGEPFGESTVGALAGQLETTPLVFDEDLGQTLGTLPETATSLTSPLANGNQLAVLSGTEGLVMGLLGRGTEVIEGGTGGEGGGSGGSGSGGTGGTGDPGGGSSNPGTTTVLVENVTPQSSSTPSSPTPSTSGASAIPGKLEVLSHHTKRGVLTLLVHVPGAGKLAAGGRGMHSLRRETAKAERVTLKLHLTRTAASRLHRHHRLRGAVKVSFKRAGGPSSSVRVLVAFG